MMDLGLSGRTALAVGSTSGLGLAFAQALGAEQANLVVCGRRSVVARHQATALPSAIGVELDLAGPDTVADALDQPTARGTRWRRAHIRVDGGLISGL